MIYYLDTNTVSALMKGNPAVVDRLAGVSRADVRLPQPVLAEISYGLERLSHSKRRSELQTRFELICTEIARAEWTDDVSQAFGHIKAMLERRGQRIEDFDAAIAAHALAANATLVTSNIDQLTRITGLKVEDWATSGA